MKRFVRFFLALSIIGAIPALVGCDMLPGKADYLAPLSAPFTLSGSAEIDGVSYGITVTSTADAITIETAAETGLPLTFTKTESGILLEADGASAPLPRGTEGGIPALFPLFSLTRADLTAVTKDQAGEVPLTRIRLTPACGAVTLILNAQTGHPIRIEATVHGTEIVLSAESFTPAPSKAP